jgi:hypothetical protein
MGSPITFAKFHDLAKALNLETRQCSDCHWQVKANGVTVNVWPLSGNSCKFLQQGAKAGRKAMIGGISDALQLCARAAACNGVDASRSKPHPVAMNGAATLSKLQAPDRWRLTIQQNEGGSFTIISHGDAIEEVTFDEMLGIVCNVFHTPTQKRRAESLFASEKSFRRRREQAAPSDFAVVE